MSEWKILHWGRNGRRCRIVFRVDGGPLLTRDFPAGMRDAEIRKELSAEIPVAVPKTAAEPESGQPSQPSQSRKKGRPRKTAAVDAKPVESGKEGDA